MRMNGSVTGTVVRMAASRCGSDWRGIKVGFRECGNGSIALKINPILYITVPRNACLLLSMGLIHVR